MARHFLENEGSFEESGSFSSLSPNAWAGSREAGEFERGL